MRPWIASGIAVLLGGVGWLFFRSPQPDASAAGVVASKDESNSQSGAVPRNRDRSPSAQLARVEWPVGERLRYALEQGATIKAASGELVFQFSMRGTLEIAALDEESLRVAFAPAPGSLTLKQAHGSVDAGSLDLILKELGSPFFLRTSPDVTVSPVFAEHVSPFTAQLWRSLVSAWALRTQPDADVSSWSAQEPGPIGTCSFEYRLESANHVTKHAASCAPTTLAGDVPAIVPKYERLSLTRDFVLQGSVIERLEIEDHMTTEPMDMVGSLSTDGSLVLQLQGRERLTDTQAMVWQTERDALPSAQDQERQEMASREEMLDRQRLGGRDVPGILAQMLAAMKHLDDVAKRRGAERAYVALVAALRLEPEKHLPALREHIERSGPLTEALVSSLQDSGTVPAQKLLAELLQNQTFAPATRNALARGLALVSAPSEISVKALGALKNDPVVGRQATYGLGSNAFKLKRSNPELANEVTRNLLDELKSSPGTDRQSELLTALGNAGSPEALPALKSAAQDPSVTIRAAAAQGLRRIETAESYSLLTVLAGDASANVRRSAIDALSEGAPSEQSAAIIGNAATTDQDFRVRSLSVQAAVRWLRDVPSLAGVLRAVASSDENADLREMADDALRKSAG